MSEKSEFIEHKDTWLSCSRRGVDPRGAGKWMLHTDQPHELYALLKEQLLAGKLQEAFSIKTRTEIPASGGSVYLHTGPYTDRSKLLRLAEELREINDSTPLGLKPPLVFKTDLHNTWCETIARPGDGYYELLKRNWLYKYENGKLIIRAAILGLHQMLEDPPHNADPEFLIIRSMLPEHMFAGERPVSSEL